MKQLVLLILAVFLVAPMLGASDTDISTSKVEIRYQFEGASLVTFGTVRESDLPDPFLGQRHLA